jgi:branched-chain amino acid transport system ATP-binding protein
MNVMSDPILDVSGLTAGYGDLPVVRDVSLTVARGEIVALVGANGAGKTTTLSAITGVLKPQSGTVVVTGNTLKNHQLHRLKALGAAYLPDDRCLFADLTTAENLRMARGTRPIDELLEWLPALRPLMKRKAGLLSGGEQQMLALARALASRPSILLVDEMSAGLAPIIVQQLLTLLRRLADEEQLAVLLVEQHVELALACADRGYVLRHGELVSNGSTDDLAADRRNLEASYLGEAEL